MTVQVPGRADVYLERAEIEHSERVDEWTPEHWTVRPVWAGVDRPKGSGTACSNPKIAARLKRAIEDGAAIGTPEVKTDNAGNTYVAAPHKYLARTLNADLHRMGY
jgi:hypothetical protein